MLHLDLDGRYADVLELALFNGALSGLSRDGEHYFYSNPLESDGRHARWAWHTCPCCTMNVSRLVASVGGYFVSAGDDAIAFHLYGGIPPRSASSSATSRSARRVPTPGPAPSGSPSPPRPHRVRPQAPHPRLGPRRHGKGQRRDRRRPCRHPRRLPHHHPHLAAGRPRRARPPDAARAPLRPPRRHGRCRPRGAPARAARLLPRGRRQSRRPGAAPQAAMEPPRSASSARAPPLRRDRHALRRRLASRRSRLARRRSTAPPAGPGPPASRPSPTTSGTTAHPAR